MGIDMPSIGDALTYPTEHDDWIKTVLIGGGLSIFGFLLLPILPVYGYLVRVIRHTLAGDPQPPTFGEWEELFIDGLQALVISVAYLIVPGIVGIVTFGGAVAAMATGSRGGAAAGLAGLGLGFLLTFVLTIVFGYVAVAALVNFAREERIGAAFDVATLRGIVTDGDYAIAWGLSVVVFIGAGIVTSLLNVIPFLGAIIGAFVFFYVQIVAATLWADGFKAAYRNSAGADWSGTEETAV